MSTSLYLQRKARSTSKLFRILAITVIGISLMPLMPVAEITNVVRLRLRAPDQNRAGHFRGTVLAHHTASDGVPDHRGGTAQEITLIVENATLATTAVDVFLVVDLSGSLADDLLVFKTQAPQIIAELTAANPNTRFGLGKFEDYPIPHFGDAAAGDKAYERLVDLTFDTDLIVNTIAGLFTRDGVDPPESQLPALYQAATGAGQDLAGLGFPEASIPPGQQANFRAGTIKLFLLWTDASFHHPGDAGSIPYPGPSFTETVAAILALDAAEVIGITSGGGGMADLQQIAAATDALTPASGVDCDEDGMVDLGAGQPLVCRIASSGEGIGEAMSALIRAATAIPIAEAGGPYQSATDEPVAFDGSGSFDLDGTIVLYEWDFDNDGTVDVSATAPTATHTYPAAFSGMVALRVTDNDGKMGVDTAPVAVTVPTADLSLTKTALGLVTTGQNLTYTLTVVNHGPDNATGVTVVDPLPAGVTFVSTAASQGNCAEVSGVVTCNLGTLANGANATVTIVVTAMLEGTIINTATVTSDTSDPDTDNNSDDAQTVVQPPTLPSTSTPTSTATPTATATPTPTATPTWIATSPTGTATPTSTSTPTFTATSIAAVTPTLTVMSTATATATLEPTAAAMPPFTATPTSTPTALPTSVGGGGDTRIYLPVIQN